MSCFHEKLTISCFFWQYPRLGLFVLMIHSIGLKDLWGGWVSQSHSTEMKHMHTKSHTHEKTMKSLQDSILFKLIKYLICFSESSFYALQWCFIFRKYMWKHQFIWFTFSNLFCILLRKFYVTLVILLSKASRSRWCVCFGSRTIYNCTS